MRGKRGGGGVFTKPVTVEDKMHGHAQGASGINCHIFLSGLRKASLIDS